MGIDWKSCKSGEIGHSEPLWWEKIGKVANRVKLAILSHFGGKRLEKLQIGRNWSFRVILSHFNGKRLKKVANQVKLAIPSHSEPLQWEKIEKVANW